MLAALAAAALLVPATAAQSWPGAGRADGPRAGWARSARPARFRDSARPPPPGWYGPDPEAGAAPPRRQRCGAGPGGTILGAIAAGLLGGDAGPRDDRDAGTLISAGVGALAGHAVDRGC